MNSKGPTIRLKPKLRKFCRDIQKRSNIPMKTANSSKMNLSSIHFFNRQFNRYFINKSRTHFTVFGICCLFFIFVRILFVSFFTETMSSSNQNVLPLPSVLRTPYLALWLSRMPLTIDKPSPVPITPRLCSLSTL